MSRIRLLQPMIPILPLALLLFSELANLSSVAGLVLLQFAILSIVWQGRRDLSLSPLTVRHCLIAVVVGGTLLLMALAIGDQFQNTHDPNLVRLILAFLATGLGLLVGTFPFHLWLPPLCRDLSRARLMLVMALLRPLGSALLICALINAPWLLSDNRSLLLLSAGGALAALACATLSLAQNGVVDRLVYLATADLGFVLVGASSGSRVGVLAALLVIVNHVLAMTLLVGGLSLVDRLASPIRKIHIVPLASMVVGALALVGAPPSSGFPGRLAIYQATLGRSPLLVAILLVSTALMGLSLLQGGLTYTRAYTKPSIGASRQSVPRLPIVGIALVIVLVLGIGLYPAPLMDAMFNGLGLGNLP